MRYRSILPTVIRLALIAFLVLAPAAVLAQPAAPELVDVAPVTIVDGAPWIPSTIAFVVAIAAFLSAIIPDSKMPGWLAAILNFVALNLGRARNDPAANR